MRSLVAVAAAAVLATAAAHGAAAPTRRDADAFQEKIVRIALAERAATAAGVRRTPITETELNSWFAFHGRPLVPEGIAEPRITLVGSGRVAGEAIVDVDAIAKKRATGSMLDPWSYLGGKVPVAVHGILYTRDGVGRFEVQTAEVSGVPVPKTILQELVAYYSRTPQHPEGVSMDDPFDLPAGIRSIEVGQGQAVVVQ
jgi:hypothetical protein